MVTIKGARERERGRRGSGDNIVLARMGTLLQKHSPKAPNNKLNYLKNGESANSTVPSMHHSPHCQWELRCTDLQALQNCKLFMIKPQLAITKPTNASNIGNPLILS